MWPFQKQPYGMHLPYLRELGRIFAADPSASLWRVVPCPGKNLPSQLLVEPPEAGFPRRLECWALRKKSCLKLAWPPNSQSPWATSLCVKRGHALRFCSGGDIISRGPVGNALPALLSSSHPVPPPDITEVLTFYNSTDMPFRSLAFCDVGFAREAVAAYLLWVGRKPCQFLSPWLECAHRQGFH